MVGYLRVMNSKFIINNQQEETNTHENNRDILVVSAFLLSFSFTDSKDSMAINTANLEPFYVESCALIIMP